MKTTTLITLLLAGAIPIISPAFGAPVETCPGVLDVNFRPTFGNSIFAPSRALARADGKVWIGAYQGLLRMNQHDEVEFRLRTEAPIKDMTLQTDGEQAFT